MTATAAGSSTRTGRRPIPGCWPSTAAWQWKTATVSAPTPTSLPWNYLKKLYDDHCAWLSTEPLPFDSFARRSALFISADLSELPLAAASMTRLNNADQWELIPFPGPDRQVVVTYGPSYTVMKSTDEKQVAAWLFARWMLSPENQSQWIDATGLLPLRTSVLPTVDQFRQATPQWDAAVEQLEFAQGVPQLASWRKVRYVLEDGLNTIFQTNLPIAQFPSILMEMDTLAAEMNEKYAPQARPDACPVFFGGRPFQKALKRMSLRAKRAISRFSSISVFFRGCFGGSAPPRMTSNCVY